MPGPLLYVAVFDSKKGVGFTLIYRDANKVAWGKKVRIERFITNKVYSLVKEGPSASSTSRTGKRRER